MNQLLRLGAAAGLTTAALGAGTLAYAHFVELKRFTVRHVELPVRGLRAPLRILHISDVHYVPGQRQKFEWLQSLAELRPDVVVNTGDNLSHPAAVPEVLQALAPLRAFPGVFVPGSNDYYAPQFRNPLKYFRGPSEVRHTVAEQLPTEELFAGFTHSGWIDLTNRHTAVHYGGLHLHFSGTDDAHIDRDTVTGWPEGPADLRLAVTHSPMRRVLEAFTRTGADLILAGHTHGGQVCLPGRRALVTNCDLPPRQASGLSEVTTATRNAALHVSAGIGTSAKAPIRLFCPPEATLLTVTPA
ncbi:metallophosphoesterase [Nesterenkonia alba]|uniref:metallophosphoesterase n=1 Tax=Nesterenkonia alba TaxID=515814 RepID=UPI0003B657FE|nr:metallophosphoesterase [Nesterenkonia alba]